MSKYLVYDLIALEDLKFSKTNAQSESEETMEYIPGTAIRGGYIYKYIVHKKVKDINEGIHREKLLNGRIKFLNAHPKYESNRSIPFPKVYFAPKESLKSFSEKLNILSGLDTKLESGYERVRLSEFVGFSNRGYTKIDIEKGENLHINRMKGKENNKLFRYEFMKKGQVFQGIIKVEVDEDIDEIKELFEEEIVYLGGSKGSGYGKCSIGELKILDDNPEYINWQEQQKFEKEIYLIALSDIIFRNEIGEYKTFIPGEFIQKELGLEDGKLIDSSIETKSITNFNNKWNCSTPNINAIKKGSVFKYEIKGKVEISLLNKFINRGIGERKLDGFGRFILLDSIKDSYIEIHGQAEGNLDEDNNFEMLSKVEETQLQEIIDRIYRKRLEDDISRRVMKINEDIKNGDMMNNSQWGSLKALFTSLLYEESKEGIKKYNNYMDHIKDKMSNSFKQLNRVKYLNNPFLDFLDEFVKNSQHMDKLEKNSFVQKIVLGELKSNVDSEFLYSYNIKILNELCRYEIRKGER